jgi:uncharacterized small protein (DUF1192 family)
MNRYIAKPSRGGPIDNEARERKLRGIIAKLEDRVAALEAEMSRRKGGRPKANGAVTGEQAQVV